MQQKLELASNTDTMVEQMVDEIDWNVTAIYNIRTEAEVESYLRENKLSVDDMAQICIRMVFSDAFFFRNVEFMNEEMICLFIQHQFINQSVIEMMAYRANGDRFWKLLAQFQVLSEEFIEQHIDKMDRDVLLQMQPYLSDAFIAEYLG